MVIWPENCSHVNGWVLFVLWCIILCFVCYYYYLCQCLRAFLEDRSRNWYWIDSSATTTRLFMVFYFIRDFISLKSQRMIYALNRFLVVCRALARLACARKYKPVDFGSLSPWNGKKKTNRFLLFCCGIRQTHQKYAIIGLPPLKTASKKEKKVCWKSIGKLSLGRKIFNSGEGMEQRKEEKKKLSLQFGRDTGAKCKINSKFIENQLQIRSIFGVRIDGIVSNSSSLPLRRCQVKVYFYRIQTTSN